MKRKFAKQVMTQAQFDAMVRQAPATYAVRPEVWVRADGSRVKADQADPGSVIDLAPTDPERRQWSADAPPPPLD